MLIELKQRLDREIERLGGRTLTAYAPGGGRGEPTGSSPSSDPHVRERIRYLGKVAAALPLVERKALVTDGVGLGATVSLLDTDTGKETVYTLLDGEDIDFDAGEISLASPIGQALLGKGVGEEVVAHTPRGERTFRILAVKTLAEQLELVEDYPLHDPAA